MPTKVSHAAAMIVTARTACEAEVGSGSVEEAMVAVNRGVFLAGACRSKDKVECTVRIQPELTERILIGDCERPALYGIYES